jgi:hypothetical protein
MVHGLTWIQVKLFRWLLRVYITSSLKNVVNLKKDFLFSEKCQLNSEIKSPKLNTGNIINYET